MKCVFCVCLCVGDSRMGGPWFFVCVWSMHLRTVPYYLYYQNYSRLRSIWKLIKCNKNHNDRKIAIVQNHTKVSNAKINYLNWWIERDTNYKSPIISDFIIIWLLSMRDLINSTYCFFFFFFSFSFSFSLFALN